MDRAGEAGLTRREGQITEVFNNTSGTPYGFDRFIFVLVSRRLQDVGVRFSYFKFVLVFKQRLIGRNSLMIDPATRQQQHSPHQDGKFQRGGTWKRRRGSQQGLHASCTAHMHFAFTVTPLELAEPHTFCLFKLQNAPVDHWAQPTCGPAPSHSQHA